MSLHSFTTHEAMVDLDPVIRFTVSWCEKDGRALVHLTGSDQHYYCTIERLRSIATECMSIAGIMERSGKAMEG